MTAKTGSIEGRGRREFLSAAAGLAGAAAAGACGRTPKLEPRAAAVGPRVTWRIQNYLGGQTESFKSFKRFCARVGELSEGKLIFEPNPPDAIVGVFDMFEAVKSGRLDGAGGPPHYAADKIPELAFLSSYPLGLDRPDQWESWFYGLGGLELARRMYEPHNIQYVGPVQHDLNIIHSRVPIRSLADLRDKRVRMPGGLIAEVFAAAGAKTVFTAPDQIYAALANGSIDAADFVGPAMNYELGYAKIAKYIILGPPSTPSMHQPCDLLCIIVNKQKWDTLSPYLQDVVQSAVRWHSWEFYGAVQKANTLSWSKYAESGVEIIRFSNEDVATFRRIAIPVWFRWAKRSPLGREALASQLAYMKSPAVGYVDDSMLVDREGRKLALDD